MHLEEGNLSFWSGLAVPLKAIRFFKPGPRLINSLVDLFLCSFPVLDFGPFLLCGSPENRPSLASIAIAWQVNSCCSILCFQFILPSHRPKSALPANTLNDISVLQGPKQVEG